MSRLTPDVTVLCGDAWDLAEDLAPGSIDCIVTSPPYWGLRDYGHPDQFGLERTPQEYVAKLVDLFARLRPALKDDGTVWLNLGDSYASGTGNKCITPQTAYITGRAGGEPWGAPHKTLEYGKTDAGFRDYGVLKPKDLCGIPWRVAFALQDDGWYLRSDIIWSKPNPMPESVTDRPTKSHEYVFLLSKNQRYYFDQEAVREPHQESSLARIEYGLKHRHPDGMGVGIPPVDTDRMGERFCNPNGRNIRTVWTIATQPYSGAHFATMPPELAGRCIKAGTSERGVCPECGKAWERWTERVPGDGDLRCHGTSPGAKHLQGPLSRLNSGTAEQYHANRDRVLTRGWSATCTCDAAPIPATVLDPFAGSGTTLYVARKLGRNSIGFELNEDYRPLIEDRLKQGVLL